MAWRLKKDCFECRAYRMHTHSCEWGYGIQFKKSGVPKGGTYPAPTEPCPKPKSFEEYLDERKKTKLEDLS